ncbi:hypothetical protein MMC15_002040 [Xylographa vitiligo]|nr:hypothetical protein [Xylographa vitiligo]
MTPACIAALYQVPPGDKAHPVNAMEIFEFRDNYGNSSLDLFFAKFAPQVPQGTCPTEANIEFTDYATVQPGESGEVDLDFDVAYPANEYKCLFNGFLDGIDGVIQSFVDPE